MKKWTEKLVREVRDSLLRVDGRPSTSSTSSAFQGQGRTLGGRPAEARGEDPVSASGLPPPQSRSRAVGSGAVPSPASPYDAILRVVDDDACIDALRCILAGVDGGREEREETQESLRILGKILSNVIAAPENGVVRTLRLGNPRVARYIVKREGAEALLDRKSVV